jgi:hypothetical protein
MVVSLDGGIVLEIRLVVYGLAADRSDAKHTQRPQQTKDESLHDVPRLIRRVRPVGRATPPSSSSVLDDGIPLKHGPRQIADAGGGASFIHPQRMME